MRRVSLNKIKLSMITKVPGMVILGVSAIAFLLFPFTVLAGCGGGGQAAQAATIESTESLFSKSCGGTPLSTQQASELESSWAKAPQSKNATVSTTAPKTSTSSSSSAATAPNNGVLSGISLLGAVARCTFVTAPSGQNVTLNNGDLVLASVANKDGSTSAIIGEIIGGKFVAVTGNNGKHFVKLNNNPNIKFTNGSISNNG